MPGNNSTKFYLLLLLIATLMDIAKTTRCGEYICDEKSTCVYNQEKSELNCICDEDFVKDIQNKFIFCYQPEIGNDVVDCLKVDDNCGPNHKCNEDLLCQEINGVIDLSNACPMQQKCLDNCCLENEICQDGIKCMQIPAVSLDVACAESKKCADKCCLHNEVCTKENECVAKEILNILNESIASACVESNKCQDKCCADNEICKNGKECILKLNETVHCSDETQKCFTKCCALNEFCLNDIECVPKESRAKKCPGKQHFCLIKCCAENEICNKENKCISQGVEQITQTTATVCPEFQKCGNKCCSPNEICNESGSECVVKTTEILECPKSLQCNDKCCSEKEICENGAECIAKEVNGFECPALQKCLGKCCAFSQICNADNQCVDAANESVIISTIADNFDCAVSQRCLNKCCFEHEKCNEKYECVSSGTNECLDTTEKCGNTCCPINETCNEENECVPFLEVTTIENCSQKLKCQTICCAPLQVCNELHECVNKSLKDSTNLYDLPNEITTNKKETINDYDTIIPIYDFDDVNKNSSCPKYYNPCQEKCCHEQQICNKMGECEEKMNETNCVSGPSCLGNANIKDAKISAAYTMIGLSCLILVIAFGLFKLYNFRRSQHILY